MSKAEAETTVRTETYWEKYGIPRVTIKNAVAQIELSLLNNVRRGAFCLISDAGWGKSQSIAQLARTHGYRAVDVRTAQFGLMSGGVPQRADEETGMFKIAVPAWFPKPGEKCILLFDEINQGQNHAIAMFFQMLEDRRFFDYVLPEETIIVALMNPSTMAYQVSKIETNAAINRRMKKFYVYSTFEEWKEHAETEDFHHSDGDKKPCHPWVMRFLGTTRNALYDSASRDGNKQFACPATWQTVSKDLYILDHAKVALASEFARDRLSASIGTVMTKSLCDYIENNEVRISPDEIIKGYKTKSKLRDRVLEQVKKAGGGIPDICENLAAFMFEEKPDVQSAAPKLALFCYDLPSELMQQFYSLLGAAAHGGSGDREKKNIDYMMALTEHLQQEPCWETVNQRLMQDHDAFEGALKGKTGSSSPDPMEGTG